MKLTKKEFTKKVQAKLIEEGIVPNCPLEGADSVINVIFETLKDGVSQPHVDSFVGWGVRIKKSILPPRKLVNLHDKDKLIEVPEKARYYFKILDTE